jgi:hypothetical protein
MRLLTDRDVAHLLGVSVRRVRTLWRTPGFPGRKVCRLCLTEEAAFLAWLSQGHDAVEVSKNER